MDKDIAADEFGTTATIELTEDMADRLEAALKDFARDADLSLAVTIDPSGALLAGVASRDDLDVSAVCALAAGVFAASHSLARAFGEQHPTDLIQHGEAGACLIQGMGRLGLLLAVVDGNTPVGLVRHRAAAVAEEILEQLFPTTAEEAPAPVSVPELAVALMAAVAPPLLPGTEEPPEPSVEPPFEPGPVEPVAEETPPAVEAEAETAPAAFEVDAEPEAEPEAEVPPAAESLEFSGPPLPPPVPERDEYGQDSPPRPPLALAVAAAAALLDQNPRPGLAIPPLPGVDQGLPEDDGWEISFEEPDEPEPDAAAETGPPAILPPPIPPFPTGPVEGVPEEDSFDPDADTAPLKPVPRAEQPFALEEESLPQAFTGIEFELDEEPGEPSAPLETPFMLEDLDEDEAAAAGSLPVPGLPLAELVEPPAANWEIEIEGEDAVAGPPSLPPLPESVLEAPAETLETFAGLDEVEVEAGPEPGIEEPEEEKAPAPLRSAGPLYMFENG